MAGKNVAVLRTGVANLASVLAGLRRAGAEPRVVEDAASVTDAKRLVLPGVGSYGAALHRLRAHRLVNPLVERLRTARATLAICLGMQLLAEGSDESPHVPGLGVLPVRATRFPAVVRIPHLGWNEVQTEAGCGLLRPGYAYFANSYRITVQPDGWRCALAEHGGAFLAALERGPILACQFHPELSGTWGVRLVRRWLARSEWEHTPC